MLDKWRFLARYAVGTFHDRTVSAAERLLPRLRLRVCPCCGWSGLRFRSFAAVEYVRHDAVCPGCGAFERHRALASFYPRFFGSLGLRLAHVVHFAPEKCLERVVTSFCDRYDRSNFGGGGRDDLGLDLTRLDLADASCDTLLLNCVLDCMGDDRRAATEMYRVLTPGGVALGVVGFEPGAVTRELPVASNARRRIFGSRDLSERFAPFAARVVNAAEGIDAAERQRSGIPAPVWVLVLCKPDGRARC